MRPGARSRGALRIRDAELVWGERTYLMGIVNATPDSFSGDGTPESTQAIARALSQAGGGADVIDIGAESTRPGHTPVEERLELERLLPVIRGVREQLGNGSIISADTFKPAIFRAAYHAGADILNSVWGLDDALLAAAVECNVPVVIMHNKAVPVYEGHVVDEVIAFLDHAAARANNAGISQDRIILDPGIGFGKLPDHNLAILSALQRIVQLGFPTLLGSSRKSTIGKVTGRQPSERTYGTAATVALAVAAGIDIVRVHDVSEMRDVVRMSDAIVRGWRPPDWT
ncbi:MAG: dihydropteroate synthase [Candidatus Eremiobacteraeota bacterium]|nr:dihydropteroate synthase [Candidatus Eremiobacteraeota bacterium]